jgi:hypothetical protein
MLRDARYWTVMPLALIVGSLVAAMVPYVAVAQDKGTTSSPAATEIPAPDSPNASKPEAPATETTDQDGDQVQDEEMNIGEIPVVETVELDPEKTKKAIDLYGVVREKYQDSGLENYEDLQDFVDKTDEGKKFEADIKAAGFATVNEWNLIISSASFAYTNELDDQSEEITLQIEDLKVDTELAQDMKDKMIKSLEAMIPSANNKKIISDLMKDPAYTEKIKILEIEEE